jgi:hypothetical protein
MPKPKPKPKPKNPDRITLRVSPALRERMWRLEERWGVSWSAVAAEAFEEKCRALEELERHLPAPAKKPDSISKR